MSKDLGALDQDRVVVLSATSWAWRSTAQRLLLWPRG